MSQGNVEIVRTYLKLWNAGSMEGVRELYDPDAVMEGLPDWPEPGPFVGRDAVMQELNLVRAAFDSDSVELLSDVAVGDRVIVRMGWHGSGRGPQSDMPGPQPERQARPASQPSEDPSGAERAALIARLEALAESAG
jgi:hypothetical protein